MPSREIWIDAAGLDALCPFHIVWDEALRCVQRGSTVARLLPGLTTGTPLGDCFTVRLPRRGATFDALLDAARRGRLTVLAAKDQPDLVLKGQLVVARGDRAVLFFGAPVVLDEEAVGALGLSLADFPEHLGTADYLLVARSSRTALAEAQALAEQLGGRLRTESAERERIEADLRLAHKLEAVGQLASGIAHEINTPVQFVGDNLRFLGTTFQELHQVLGTFDVLVGALLAGESAEAALGDVAAAINHADLAYLREEGPRAVAESLDGIERVSQIVRAMKDFAHPDGGDLAPADLNRAVETTLIVARNEYRHVADLVTDLEPDLPPVPVVLGEINQVLLNLIVNAAHAIAEAQTVGSRGTITVSTRRAGDEVVVEVSDTGAGIPPEIQPRIFDPFFTTKEVGRGTGQGLAVCHSIVTVRHRGRLTFTSRVGVGTTFSVTLPLAVL